ncbi:MAG TPA: GyrI-like domain-containing protein [Methylocystis sp.]|jgi:effector-binding domain-containing protein
MNFFDKLKDFWATLGRLATHWRLLGALALLIGFGALYLQKRLSPASAPPEVTADKTTPAEKAPPTESLGDNKTGAADKTEPPETPVESVSGQIVDVPARPVLVLKGQAKWDAAAKTLTDSLAKVTAAATKAGLAANGRALTVFTDTDDNGFHYEAMLPIAKAPEGKVKLADGVEIGASPAGKALKFEHRGSYDEIDATYEAITAYLDEKGLDTNNVFIEEYLTNLSDAEDANVDVDIYVFVK